MLSLFAFALVGVGAMIVAVTVATVLSVSRRRRWTLHKTPQPSWAPLQPEDRRRAQLPFVGQERRRATDDSALDSHLPPAADPRRDEERVAGQRRAA